MTSVPAAERNRCLTRAALAAALSYIFLLAVFFLPTADVFFFVMAALTIFISVFMTAPFWALLAFVTTTLLAFLTLGPLTTLPFLCFYGLWVFIKLGVEWLCFRRGWALWLDYLLKLVIAVGICLLGFHFLFAVFVGPAYGIIARRWGAWTQAIPYGVALLLLVYDRFLTLGRNVFFARAGKYIR